VLDDLHKHWCKLIPEEARLKKGEVTVQFAILKDWQLADVQITSPSGDVAFEAALWLRTGSLDVRSFGQIPRAPQDTDS
jgi:hypothetical protein